MDAREILLTQLDLNKTKSILEFVSTYRSQTWAAYAQSGNAPPTEEEVSLWPMATIKPFEQLLNWAHAWHGKSESLVVFKPGFDVNTTAIDGVRRRDTFNGTKKIGSKVGVPLLVVHADIASVNKFTMASAPVVAVRMKWSQLAPYSENSPFYSVMDKDNIPATMACLFEDEIPPLRVTKIVR